MLYWGVYQKKKKKECYTGEVFYMHTHAHLLNKVFHHKFTKKKKRSSIISCEHSVQLFKQKKKKKHLVQLMWQFLTRKV